MTAAGVARCLELQAEPDLKLNDIFRVLEQKMNDQTSLTHWQVRQSVRSRRHRHT